MKLIVASVVSPTSHLRGYLQRFLQEPVSGQFVGSGTRATCEDLTRIFVSQEATGFLLASNLRTETGFEFLYYHLPGSMLVDFAGVQLVEKAVIRESQ